MFIATAQPDETSLNSDKQLSSVKGLKDLPTGINC
uniref:Uncharacterized protein n=1 Tax=Arundo donax TaxID=35708 RepID=A0A0A9EQC2_ARUDO